MLTIGELAGYAGVTVRTVRHYHQVGLLPEPERDASGYRRYGATAVVSLIRIRTLADAGVPLSRIAEMLDADDETFAEGVRRIDTRLRAEIQRLQASRRQIAQLAAGDSLALPPEVTAYLDRLRGLGVSERMVTSERDAWILVAARWPEKVVQWMPAKMAELEDPRVVHLYRLLSRMFDSEEADEPLMAEVADIMAAMFEEAEAAGSPEARRGAGRRLLRPAGRARRREGPSRNAHGRAHARARLGRLDPAGTDLGTLADLRGAGRCSSTAAGSGSRAAHGTCAPAARPGWRRRRGAPRGSPAARSRPRASRRTARRSR